VGRFFLTWKPSVAQADEVGFSFGNLLGPVTIHPECPRLPESQGVAFSGRDVKIAIGGVGIDQIGQRVNGPGPSGVEVWKFGTVAGVLQAQEQEGRKMYA
jgi:hypothetical protein